MPWPLATEVTISGKLDLEKHSLKEGFPLLIKAAGRKLSLGKITKVAVKGDQVTLTVRNG
jgi:hypothetical protein